MRNEEADKENNNVEPAEKPEDKEVDKETDKATDKKPESKDDFVISFNEAALVRVLELVNENTFSDVELHKLIENIEKTASDEHVISVEDYDSLIDGFTEKNTGETSEKAGNKGEEE